MEWLRNIGMAGFWFFLIKGIIWLTLFLLVYHGLIDKSKIDNLKSRLTIFRKRKAKR
jgi:hypothetical protein